MNIQQKLKETEALLSSKKETTETALYLELEQYYNVVKDILKIERIDVDVIDSHEYEGYHVSAGIDKYSCEDGDLVEFYDIEQLFKEHLRVTE